MHRCHPWRVVILIAVALGLVLPSGAIAQEAASRPSIYVTAKGELFIKERSKIVIPGIELTADSLPS